MKKIILNRGRGGYGWGMKAVYAILHRKGYQFKTMASVYPKPGQEEQIEISKEEYFRIIDELANHNSECGPDNVYVSCVFLKDDKDVFWGQYSINREDPDAIAVLEELGPEFCSSGYSYLEIAEYDEDLFIADVIDSEGFEDLVLRARLTEERIRECSSVDEIVDLLRRMDLLLG